MRPRTADETIQLIDALSRSVAELRAKGHQRAAISLEDLIRRHEADLPEYRRRHKR